MTWGSDEPHCGDPKPVYLNRFQRDYLRALLEVENDLDLESRHLQHADAAATRAECLAALRKMP